MTVSRRTLLKIGAAGAGAAALGAGVAYTQRGRLKDLTPNEAAAFLRRNFAYLRLQASDDQLRRFTVEYQRRYRPLQRPYWHRLRGWGANSFQRQMDHFATTFLLSTDFFMNGENEAMPVRYMMFYHPYASPCWNPMRGMGTA